MLAGTQIVERPIVPTDAAVAEALAELPRRLVDLSERLGYAEEQRGVAVMEKRDPAPFDRQIAEFKARINELKKTKLFDGPTAMAVRDAGLWIDGTDPTWTWLDFRPGSSRDLPVFRRGNPANPGKIVPRRFLQVFSGASTPAPFGKGSGRLDLAESMLNEGKGLTARVIVNRVWGWHFGRPIVATPSNFGKLGDAPSHPELLDDLAARFIAEGWSLKWLHREIVLSESYRQASRHDGKAQAADPEDRLLWRAPRRRLEVEAWRDAILAVTGRIESTIGGASGDLGNPTFSRRTIYGKVSRQRVAPVLQSFDFPDPKRHGEIREVTTTPIQQLFFLNSPFLMNAADSLAGDAVNDRNDEASRVASLYRRILLREPTPEETERAIRLARSDEKQPRWGLALLAQALLISNEFLFVD